MTDMPTAENTTEMFYELLDLNKTIGRMSIVFLITTSPLNMMRMKSNLMPIGYFVKLLAVSTDTWYLIACIIDHQKTEKHLSDLFTLAYDMEQSQDAMYEEFF